MWRAAAALILCGCFVDHARDAAQLLLRADAELKSGNLAAATAAVEQGLRASASRADQVTEWNFRLLRAEILLTDRRPDEALHDLQAPLPAGPQFARLRARQKMLEGRAMIGKRCWPDAARILDSAYSLSQTAGDPETLVSVETLQGSRLIYQGQLNAADKWLQSALQHARDDRLPYLEAGILVNFGRKRLAEHHYGEALEYFERAASIDGARGTTPYFSAQTNLAICSYRLGDFDRALQVLLALDEQQQLAGAKPYLEMALGETGTAYLLDGDERHAAEYLERALQVAKEVGSNSYAPIWAGNLATLYAQLGEWGKAERFNEEAIRIKTVAGSSTLVYNALNSARIAIGLGKYADGERIYQNAIDVAKGNPAVLWEAYGSLGESALLQHDPSLACRRFESAVNVVEQARAELSKTEYKLPFLSRLIRFYQQYVDALIEQGDYDRALGVADSSRAQVLAERFGSGSISRQPPAAVPGTAILTYWLDPQHSHGWVITSDRGRGEQIHHIDLPPEPAIAALVSDYSDAIQRRLADPMRTRIPSGERLYELLVQPLRKWIPTGSRVVIVPDGVLSSLNFESLPVPGANPHYWIEDATIMVAPSIGVLNHALQTRTAGHAAGGAQSHGRGLLLIGDPEDTDPSLPPLVHASAEIDDVLRHFDADSRLVLRRKDAVPQSYKAAGPGRFEVIHFTAHAVANRESPLDSAVMLSGGKLYARDLMESPLNAELVTFSACRGAGSRSYRGEGLVGFAWAFLRAGARNVIAGLWDVNDQSTAELMDVCYREIAAGKKPQDALRTAKLALIHAQNNFHKPYYWGPFQLYTLAP